jgi:hypothetical protein
VTRADLTKRGRVAIALFSTAVISVGAYFGLLSVDLSFVFPSIQRRLASAGDASVPQTLWRMADLLGIVSPLAAQALCLLCAACAVAMWLARRERSRLRQRTGPLSAGLVVSVIATAILGIGALPWTLSRMSSCRVTMLESAFSHDTPYGAAVVETECGDDIVRDVVVTRWPFHRLWAAQSLVRLNGRPVLHVTWQGHMLTIVGDRAADSMARPFESPWCCVGEIAATYTR